MMSFENSGPYGKDTCLIHEALGINLEAQDLMLGQLVAPDPFAMDYLSDIPKARALVP
jgi:hypothetical protein